MHVQLTSYSHLVSSPTIPWAMSSFTRFRSNFRSQSAEYQALPVSNSRSNSPLSPPPPLSRNILPRRNRYTLLSILLLTIPTILFLASRHHSQVDQYVSAGVSWRGDSEGGMLWLEKLKEWSGGCRGWDPDLPEDQDPEGCIKAKQYRQTMRVLAREEKADQYVQDPASYQSR